MSPLLLDIQALPALHLLPIADNLSNHQSNIAGWIATLKCDPKFIFKAASQASRAVDFILSFSKSSDEVEQPAEELVLV